MIEQQLNHYRVCKIAKSTLAIRINTIQKLIFVREKAKMHNGEGIAISWGRHKGTFDEKMIGVDV